MKIKTGFYTALLVIFSLSKISAAKFIVAPAGGNFTTIQAGLNAANAGDTVLVKPGTYNEAVSFPRSGTLLNGYITLLAEAGGILDGTGKGQLGILIRNRNYIKVIGMEVQNFISAGTPIGISIEGSSSNLEIKSNKVHNIENANGNAHGIAIYGTSATPISNILLDGNEIRNCLLGQSESLVLNGNVTNFIVSNNIVHDNDNIGIDFIGFEGVGPTGSDQARNGICVNNTVYNISTLTNPTYGGDRNADGIYVDGGSNITIERNTVYNCDIGIELASEHLGKNTQDIIVRNNFVSGSYQANIMAGGYDSNRGNAINITIVNNTTYQGNGGELALQFNCNTIIIKNNIFYAKASQDYLQEWGNNNTNIAVSNNLYFGQSTTSPGAWGDASARYLNPRLTNAPTNMHLMVTSLAIDAGLNLGNDGSGNAISGTLDIDNQARVNSAIDIGADEYGIPLPVEFLNLQAKINNDNAVLVSWQTASEKDNEYFEIQRLDSGKDTWQSIGQVGARGNSNTIQTYQFYDYTPLANNYYRLKQVDIDGLSKFSQSVFVALKYDFLILNTNLNPVQSVLQVSINSPSEEMIYFKVYDLFGRKVMYGEKMIYTGINHVDIDTSSFSEGSYVIQFTNTFEVMYLKFIKQ